MFMKSIFLALSGETEANATAEAAFLLTKTFNAHLVGSHTVAEAGPFLDQTGIGMMAAYYDELYQTAEKVQTHKRQTAVNVFERAREKYKVTLAGKPEDYGPTCHWRDHDGDVDVVARLGRLADVIVLTCPGERSSYSDLRTLEQAVFHARRPVFMVPAQAQADISAPMLVAWNGSAEAARALINAVPLLTQGGAVTLLQVGSLEAGSTAIDEAEAYLRLHGIGVTTKVLERGKMSVAECIANEAERVSARCLVMGAYTHNPWREIVLGGVTQSMIRNAHVPVFFAH